MTLCSSSCREAHDATDSLGRELRLRKWLGILWVAGSCGLAYLAYTRLTWLWLPCALAGWFGTYQTLYSKGCTACGAPQAEDVGPLELTRAQRAGRRRMAYGFLAGAAGLALAAAKILALFWPLAAIAAWFGASFFVASRTGYAGCPEVGAIPSWLLGRTIATRCPPLDRIDARRS